MSDSWKQVEEDVDCPLPDEFWHIEFINGTYDRISIEQAEKIISEIEKANYGSVGWMWIENLSGGRIFINTDRVLFLGQNTGEVRRLDRMHTRWFQYEAKKDTYLKSVADDD